MRLLKQMMKIRQKLPPKKRSSLSSGTNLLQQPQKTSNSQQRGYLTIYQSTRAFSFLTQHKSTIIRLNFIDQQQDLAMQELHRIDITQISNHHADQQHPITLHYGHHYLQGKNNNIKKHPFPSLKLEQITAPSACLETEIIFRPKRQMSFESERASNQTRDEENRQKLIEPRPIILSLKQIKEREKKEKRAAHQLAMYSPIKRGSQMTRNNAQDSFFNPEKEKLAKSKIRQKLSLSKKVEPLLKPSIDELI